MGAIRAFLGLVIIYGAYKGNLTLIIIGFAALLVNYFNDDTRNEKETNDDDQSKQKNVTAGNNKDRISCPFCAEKIMSEAKVCRFCSKDIPIPIEIENSQLTEKTPELDATITASQLAPVATIPLIISKPQSIETRIDKDNLRKLGYVHCGECNSLNKVSYEKCFSCEAPFTS